MDEQGVNTAKWWQPYLNEVLYPVQFDRDPSASVARGLEGFFRSRSDEAREFVAAIEAALASGDTLLLVGEPGPVPQSQADVRGYLTGMAHGIEERLQPNRTE